MSNPAGTQKIAPLIGTLAVKNQLITEKELEKGLLHCAGAEDPEIALKAYFRENELISRQNLDRLSRGVRALEIRRMEFRFGAIAVRKGFINQSLLDLALEEQERDIRNGNKPRRIGDMMVDSGLMTVKQRDYILKLQKRSKSRQQSEKQASPAGKAPQAAEKTAIPKAVPELLAPEIIFGGIQLQIAGDHMAALMTKTERFDPSVSVSKIKETLSEKGIVTGIAPDDAIEGFVNSSGFKTKAFRVARGVRPVEGKDAKLEYFFDTEHLKAGGLDTEGNIDFRERGEIPHVAAGTVLAEKTPVVASRRGHDIFGEEVETESGQDLPMRFGKGAKLSEDGLKILAAVKGYPKFSLSGVIYVYEEYATAGDVDYETGHIEYDGNVRVNGCIKSGFKVKANEVDTVEVDGGSISAEGDVVVNGGINEGTIYARGNVTARFIHNSRIVAMGSVKVAKEIVDSTIECGGGCIVEIGKLISSTVTAKMGVSAINIGTEMADPCKITVGQDAFTNQEMKKIQTHIVGFRTRITEMEEKHDALKQENMELQRQITKLAHVQDRAQLERQEVEKQLESLGGTPGSQEKTAALNARMSQLESNVEKAEQNLDQNFEKCEAIEQSMAGVRKRIAAAKGKLDDLLQEKSNLKQWAASNPGVAVVRVEAAIHPGTAIRGKVSEFMVRNLIRHAKIAEIQSGEGERRNHEMKVMNL